MINVLIISDKFNEIREIEENLKNNEKIRIFDSITDPNRAIEILRRDKDKINAVLLKNKLYDDDALDFLDKLNDTSISNKTIVYNYTFNEQFESILKDQGIFCTLNYPINYNKMINKILLLSNHAKQISYKDKTIDIAIQDILHEIGLSTKYKGYKHIDYIIKYLLDLKNQNKFFEIIMKIVYKDAGKEFNENPINVERNIKSIKIATFNLGPNEIRSKIFDTICKDGEIPSNKLFLMEIANYIYTNYC